LIEYFSRRRLRKKAISSKKVQSSQPPKIGPSFCFNALDQGGHQSLARQDPWRYKRLLRASDKEDRSIWSESIHFGSSRD